MRGGAAAGRGGRGGKKKGIINKTAGSEYVFYSRLMSPVVSLLISSDTVTSGRKKVKKIGRKWDDSSITEQDMAALDFSTDRPSDNESSSNLDLGSLIDETSLGTKKDGIYEVKDWDFVGDVPADDLVSKVINNSLSNGATRKEPAQASSTLGNIFARLTGSKTLTEQDLKPVLNAMKEHLMNKNVAKEIAEQICEGVGESLKGKKIGGFRGLSLSLSEKGLYIKFY